MKPSDYIPHEPEPKRKALHEFICATVAACVASIYPRADSLSFRRIIDNAVRGTEVTASAEECEAEYCTRSGCDCPCCEVAHAKLRAISFKTRPADGRKVVGDAVNAHLLAIDKACLDETNARLAAVSSEVTIVYSDHDTKEALHAAVVQAVRAATEVGHEPEDSGPR